MNAVPRLSPLRDRQTMKRAEIAREQAEAKAKYKIEQGRLPDVFAAPYDLTLEPKLKPEPGEEIESVFVYIYYRPGTYAWFAQAYVYAKRPGVETETFTASHESLGDAATWATSIVRARKPAMAQIEIRPGEANNQ